MTAILLGKSLKIVEQNFSNGHVLPFVNFLYFNDKPLLPPKVAWFFEKLLDGFTFVKVICFWLLLSMEKNASLKDGF